ncbi:MAG: hypothetical protein C0402_08475 [Thermodesulfovibrio sp.]|nr:hypothetical protein [Thermodesulfovibrio sp.]
MKQHEGSVRNIRTTVIIILLAAAAILTGPRTSSSASLTVTNTNDSGPGSLRQTIHDAVANDKIYFGVTGTITLASELLIATDMSIYGPGAASLALSGGGSNRIMKIGNNAFVYIEGLTIRNGSANAAPPGDVGGGVLVLDAVVTLSHCTVSNNSAAYGGGLSIKDGVLNIYYSTISNNSASAHGGGLFINSATTGKSVSVTANSSTFSGNQASSSGGGICSYGPLMLTNSTISNNLAAAHSGGGLAVLNKGDATFQHVTLAGNTGDNLLVTGAPNPIVHASNTIIASAVSGTNCTFYTGGSLVSNGHNLDSENSCGFTAAGDLVNAAPSIAPLALNSPGQTQTRALLSWSPAIDAADAASCPPADQRGVVRPQWGGCDIGAYEYEPVQYGIYTFPGANGAISCAPYESVSGGGNPIYHIVEQSDPVCAITPNIGYHVTDVLAGPYGTPVSVGPIWAYGFPNLQGDKTINASFAGNSGNIWLFKGPGLPVNSTTTSINGALTLAAADDDDEIRVHSGAYFEGFGMTCSGDFGGVIPILSGGWASFLARDTKQTVIAPKFTIIGACSLIVDGITIQ